MFPIPKPQFADTLEIIEIYRYYDRPVLFACHDSSGQIYLALWSDEDEDAQTETWIFTPVHEGVWQATRDGALELKVAFHSGVANRAYLVSVNWETKTSEFEEVPSSELMPERLPNAGRRLELKLEKRSLELENYARENQVTAADLDLKPANPTTHDIPARLVGGVLQSFQGLLEALLHASMTDAPSRGRIPKDIMEMAKMSVHAFNPGSFSMRLSTTSQDLYSEADKILEQLAAIIKAGDDERKLKEYSSVITRRFSARYSLFLQKLAAGNSNLQMKWVTPEGNRGDAGITVARAASAIRIIREIQEAEENNIDLEEVELIGFNASTKRFEIKDVETETRYSGIAGKEFKHDAQYTINAKYEAELIELIEINEVTYEEKTTYQLRSLKPKLN